jgi:hypothetical protein
MPPTVIYIMYKSSGENADVVISNIRIRIRIIMLPHLGIHIWIMHLLLRG